MIDMREYANMLLQQMADAQSREAEADDEAEALRAEIENENRLGDEGKERAQERNRERSDRSR